MGKRGKKKTFVSFADDSSSSTSTGFCAAVKLERMFPDLDRGLLLDVLHQCGQNVDDAANALIETGLTQEFMGPSLSLSNQQSSRKAAAEWKAVTIDPALLMVQQPEGVIMSLPPDLLLKLFGYFRTVDLIICSRCCRQWLVLSSQMLEAVQRLDLKYQSNRYNLALLASCPRVASIKVDRSTSNNYMHFIFPERVFVDRRFADRSTHLPQSPRSPARPQPSRTSTS